jgi:IMP dehydrogenase
MGNPSKEIKEFLTLAIAAGAHSVMIGNLFPGTDESPGEIVLSPGR